MQKYLILLLLVLYSTTIHAFEIPSESERIKAVGFIKGLPKSERIYFEPLKNFQIIKAPGPSDWLANQKETPQPYSAFKKETKNIPNKDRNKITLIPMGTFKKEEHALIKDIKDLSEIYFGLTTNLLPTWQYSRKNIRSRINPQLKNQQLHTDDLLSLLKKKLPKDSFCLLGITPEGLYPAPEWNYVFGMASLSERVGVYSFYRFDPVRYGSKRSDATEKIKRLRAIKLMIHETGHTFGLGHCTYYECIMKGCNHLKESDNNPLHLCPVCLRKLHNSCKFDIKKRYENLANIYKKLDLLQEHNWVIRRLKDTSDTN